MQPPILIGGNPRSGTTTVAGLLAAHGRIVMTSEIDTEAVKMALAAFDRLEAYMGKQPARSRTWKQNRARLVVELWKSVTSSPLLEGKPADEWVAHKTPGLEVLYDSYARLFAPVRPKLVYCLRNGLLVLRSLANMPWGPADFLERVERYKTSIRTFETLRAAHPDHVYLFQIDQISREPAARLEQIRALFAFLGVEMDDGVRSFVETWPSKNSMADFKEVEKAVELSDEELSLLRSDPEFMLAFRHYGYESEALERAAVVDRHRRRVSWGGTDAASAVEGPLEGAGWDLKDDPRCTSRREGDRIHARCELRPGERYYLSHGGTGLSEPPRDEHEWVVSADGVSYEVHADLDILAGAPVVQLWLIAYDAEKRLVDGRAILRKGANVARIAAVPGMKRLRIALRFAGKGEVRVGPFSLFEIRTADGKAADGTAV